jgi:hypothetical protein
MWKYVHMAEYTAKVPTAMTMQFQWRFGRNRSIRRLLQNRVKCTSRLEVINRTLSVENDQLALQYT